MAFAALGVIPARGGSKAVPNKNIAPLAGRPLIGYTIAAAKGARRLTRFVVSTDSPRIAEVARSCGADVPFMRPAELATDAALSLPVIQHAVAEVERLEGRRFDAVVMLQPTTPLRTAEDIDAGLALLEDSGADSVISVVSVGAHHPLRMKRVVAGDRLVNYIDQGHEDMRPRQQLPPVYIRSGALYIARRAVIMERGSFVGDDTRAYVMPEERSLNIDAPIDLVLGEHYLRGARGA